MNAKKTADLPAELEKARRRLDQWRQTREGRTPIPESLWATAVKMGRRYGVSRTAKVLRVGYYSLKERVEQQMAASARSATADPTPAASEPVFVELALPAQAGTGECVLEWEDAAGAKMRVHLKGVEAPDLVALSRSFWEGRQ
jgi:hypothetical protein